MKTYSLTLTTEHEDGTIVVDEIDTTSPEQLLKFMGNVAAYVEGEDL